MYRNYEKVQDAVLHARTFLFALQDGRFPSMIKKDKGFGRIWKGRQKGMEKEQSAGVSLPGMTLKIEYGGENL